MNSFSPDNRFLAFQGMMAGNADIWIKDLHSGESCQFTTDPANDTHPNWSPDGRWIAFASWRSGEGDVWVKAVDGGEARQLTTDPAQDWAPDFSPGRPVDRLYFEAERQQRYLDHAGRGRPGSRSPAPEGNTSTCPGGLRMESASPLPSFLLNGPANFGPCPPGGAGPPFTGDNDQ